MARKEDLRYVRTNRKLYETFFELIESMRIEDLSITDVCDAAKINRATFYKHFNDRKELISFCVSQKLCEIRLERSGREFVNNDTIFEDACHELFSFLRYMYKLNPKNVVMTPCHTVYILYDCVSSFYFYEFLQYFQSVDTGNDIEPDVLAAYRSGALLSAAFYCLVKDPQALSEQECDKMIAALLKTNADAKFI